MAQGLGRAEPGHGFWHAGGGGAAQPVKSLLQVLRAGAYELLARPDVPTNAAISEYLDVAHAFFDKGDARFANGVLDAVAKAVR